jgi:DNA polymerase III delta subunit
MIHLIHGDDPTRSREYFAKQKTSDSITYDAENLSLIELAQTLQGSGLFGGGTVVFIENLFGRKAKNATEIIELLNTNSKQSEIYIYSDKLLPAKSLKEFKNSEDTVFKVPQTIWAYVDGLRPDSRSNLKLFHSALDSNEPEYIFSMLVRQFRLLLGLNSGIDEIKRLAPWQIGKLQKQRSYFGEEKLKDVYKSIYTIDKKTKTGGTNLSLTQNIDLLMLSI